ncbi:MAG: pseudouridine synthase [Clostridia bacterium]
MLRLNKYIANSGVCSRRKADELIQRGVVTVNNKVIRVLGAQVDEIKDVICVHGNKIQLEEKMSYFMLNKPKGYITTNDEQFDRPCTLELIHEDVRVFPIGRLDMETEGLLLFTNDGEFANRVTHPKNKIGKIYIVKLDAKPTSEQLNKLKAGVDIGDYITKAAKVVELANMEIEIKISEGKNRQVRKMCEAVGLIVLSLRRVQIGRVKLDNLKVGEYRALTLSEVKSFNEKIRP